MVKGEIWWASLPTPKKSEPGYKRPVLIIQSDSFNRSKINTFLKSKNFSILENNLEKITFKFFPEIRMIKNKMENSGCDLTLMSGSGSAVYCITQENYITKLKDILPDIFITRTINREYYLKSIGAWPSGKAPVFGAGIRRFESSRPRGKK